ncbi:MAG: MFS transporter, partial [Candidatus Altiarchaeum hamiconexum]|nr:MFS transporter [Candidatus Altarchaeum hamiconexum]
GIFNTVFSLMCILGMLTLGVLLSYYDFKISYLLILIPGIAGFFMLFLINDLKISKTIDFKEGLKNFFNPKFLIFLPLYVAQGFLFSLTIGIIPIEIKSMFSEIFIGIFGMLFYLIPLFSAYRVGKISDRIGRPALFVTFYILIGTAMLILLNKENFIIGISVFAVAFSFTKVLLIAYVGDLCKGKNLESGNALFNTALNLGVVFGFLTLMLIENNNMDNNLIYIISFFITILSLLGFVAKRKFK